MSREKHQNLEQTTLFQIETVMLPGLYWDVLNPRQLRVEGKFLCYRKEYIPLTHSGARVMEAFDENLSDTFTFNSPEAAQKLARKLATIWDRPLRVMKVQRIRIQKQEGKIIFPMGGI